MRTKEEIEEKITGCRRIQLKLMSGADNYKEIHHNLYIEIETLRWVLG